MKKLIILLIAAILNIACMYYLACEMREQNVMVNENQVEVVE